MIVRCKTLHYVVRRYGIRYVKIILHLPLSISGWLLAPEGRKGTRLFLLEPLWESGTDGVGDFSLL